MKLNQLRYGEHFKCRMRPYSDQSEKIIDPKNPHRISFGTMVADERISDAYILNFNDTLRMVRISCPEITSLDDRVRQGKTNLFEINAILKDGSVEAEIVFFNGRLREFKEPLAISLTDTILSKDKKASENKLSARFCGIRCKSVLEYCDVFKELFTLGSKENPYFLIVGNHTADGNGDFSLVNESRQLLVKNKTDESGTLLFAYGIKNRVPRNFDNSVCLAHGELKFTDDLMGEKLSLRNANEIKSNMESDRSYIGKWDEYNDEIGRRLLSEARSGLFSAEGKAGYVAVSKHIERESKNRMRLNFSGTFEIEDENQKIDLVYKLPDYLEKSNMTYEEWIEGVDEKIKKDEENFGQPKESKEDETRLEEEKKWSGLSVKEHGDGYMIVEVKNGIKELPKRGKDNAKKDNVFNTLYIIRSIMGDKVQVMRRRKARLSIVEEKSAISSLALILDGEKTIENSLAGKTHKRMSGKVERKVFPKNPPTSAQKLAIEKALNTNDIAVIQGPPGTGKTTVICGIIESLNENFQKDERIAGKILVTALQHDAVENIIKKLSVNALPTVKLGRSSKEGENDLTTTERKIAEWSNSLASKIEEKNPCVKNSSEFLALKSLFLDYHQNPSKQMEKNLLMGIKNLNKRFTTTQILERIDAILSISDSESDIDSEMMIRLAHSLRCDETSFKDDGVQRAIELKLALENDRCGIPSSLEKACSWSEGESLDFLGELEVARDSLIDSYLPMTEYRHYKENTAINEIVAEVSKRIKEFPFDISEKKSMALADFVFELRNNPDGITDTLLRYNPVLASTVQQTEGRQINSVRKLLELVTEDSGNTPYEYVIVDEAARVIPPDLLIPLANAKHIILVGDQRQLPQQVDQEIERKLENESATKEDIEYLKKSMFEKLFSELEESKKITLDKQFRMHPLLGEFVNKEFYETPSAGREKFTSPLGADKFSHHLPLVENKAAVWIDVPNDSGVGSENRNSNKSRFRSAEVLCATKLLEKWMKSDSEKKLTFGVISFYSAQCEEILKELKDAGITEFNKKNGLYEICDEFKDTALNEKGETKERLRIGTVDAFQGMEFDAVILCVVRSASEGRIQNAENAVNPDEILKKQQGLFGFLMSKNRLCVSMSRQKKILAVTGDKNLFTSDVAKEAVPELAHFYDLCKNNKEYGLILKSEDLK